MRRSEPGFCGMLKTSFASTRFEMGLQLLHIKEGRTETSVWFLWLLAKWLCKALAMNTVERGMVTIGDMREILFGTRNPSP
jgi:hypothetical protein